MNPRWWNEGRYEQECRVWLVAIRLTLPDYWDALMHAIQNYEAGPVSTGSAKRTRRKILPAYAAVTTGRIRVPGLRAKGYLDI